MKKSDVISFLQRICREKGHSAGITISVLLIIYFLFVSSSIHNPLMWDELTFGRMCTALDQGEKSVYLDETTPEISPWYPTSYFFIMSGFLKIAGLSETGFRSLGVVFFSLSIIVLFYLSREFYKKNSMLSFHNQKYIPFAICLLYIISPFAIQGSTLIDIDTSILNFFILLFNFIWLTRLENKNMSMSLMSVSIALGLIIFAKFITAAFIVLSTVVYLFLSERSFESLRKSVVIVFVSCVTFLLGWLMYSVLSGVNATYPIDFIAGRASHVDLFSLQTVKNSILGLIRKSLWLSPFYFILLVTAFLLFVKRVFIKKRVDFSTFLWMQVILILSFYVLLGIDAAGYPKYLFPIYALSLVLISNEYVYIRKNEIIDFKKCISACFLLAVYYYIFVGDPILSTIQYKYTRFVSSEEALLRKKLLFTIFLWTLPLLMVCIFSIYAFIRKKEFISAKFFTAILVVFIASNSAVLLKQRLSDYSLLYMYGLKTESVHKTVDFVRDIIDPEEPVIMPAEIAFYLGINYRYYDVDLLLFRREFVSKSLAIAPKVIILRDHNYGTIENVNDFTSLEFRRFLAQYDYDFSEINGYKIYSRHS